MSDRATQPQGRFSPAEPSNAPPWVDRGWACRWVAPPAPAEPPVVIVYRCRFVIESPVVARVHVTADERYELLLDGVRLGRGPERGDPDNWFFESYDLHLPPGPHVLAARVWSLGRLAPWAQRSVRHGLLVAPQDALHVPLLGTGVAAWECKRQEGIAFRDPSPRMGTPSGVGPEETIDAAAFPWGIERGDGDGWVPVVAGEQGNDGFSLYPFRPAHRLCPATLPPMLDAAFGDLRLADAGGVDRHAATAFIAGAALRVPPNAAARLLVELPTYACFYPTLRVDGGAGATITLTYAEAPWPKESRTEIEAKEFRGPTDTLLADGGTGRALSPLWWRCGRWVSLTVTTRGESVELSGLELRETRYPLALVDPPRTDDPQLFDLQIICRRTLETCCHETYMDCPHYEQLMYVADARLQCLTTYVQSPDARPAIKALRMIESSRSNFNRLPTDAAPGDAKFIPTFALQWVGMVHDFATHHEAPAVVRDLLPGVRGVLDRLWQAVRGGLLHSLEGWNFVDWAAAPFAYGVPPGGEAGGASASINLLLLIALHQACALEEYAGEHEIADLFRRRAGELAARIDEAFYDPARSALRETSGGAVFTEHAQALAILCGYFDGRIRDLAPSADVVPCSAYFTHFCFEALYRLGDADELFRRLAPWLALKSQGLFTTPEIFGHTRSDCHAWTVHPLYHTVATVAGIRPRAMGGRDLLIRPLLGDVRRLRVVTPTPGGEVRVAYEVSRGEMCVRIDLPAGVAAEVQVGHAVRHLRNGSAELFFPIT